MKKETITYSISALILGLIIGGFIFSQTEIIDNTDNSQLKICQEELKNCNLVGYISKNSNYIVDLKDLIGKRIDEEWCKQKQNKEFNIIPSKCNVEVWGNTFNGDNELINIKVFCDCRYKE